MANCSFPHLAAMLLACTAASPVLAQDAQDDEENYEELIVVTGTLRQGGAQDIAHFRSISLDELSEEGLPRPDGFTLEGLLGEHDLTLPETGTCEQLFCVSTHAMPASLAGRSEDTRFIGIGFASGADPQAIRAQPVSIVAVVDRSGSMTGVPIARVKEGLHAMVDAMREGDRLGIVLYGSDTLVHQPVTDVVANRAALHAAIDAIAINGSTYMEAGLSLGYKTALDEMPRSAGRTRLMLFTDENPNVGDTSAEGFMGQALAGSRAGVGLTTIGVGVHYDGALATRISSVRGGNLFFLPSEGAGSELFAREFENMVSEVAQDLAIAIDPAPGYRVTGVFGVPGELIEHGGNGTVTVSIGSAFLSSNGGGIYATLAGNGARGSDALAEVSVNYTDAATQTRASDNEVVRQAPGAAPEALAKAQLLVDEYLGISGALAAFHERQDLASAEEQLAAVASRLSASGVQGLDGELTLLASLADQARALRGKNLAQFRAQGIMGDWRVIRHERVGDLTRGDLVEINDSGEFITQRTSGRDAGEEIYQNYAINERQLHIEGTRLVLDYDLRGNRLTLRDRMDGALIVLERVT